MKKDSLGQKIIGLLLKKAMSKSDLAEVIYNDRNVRSGISNWIKKFLKEDLIKERATNTRSILYTANLEVLGNFNDMEYKFIMLIIDRFWNPLKNDSIEKLKNLLLKVIVIKKAYSRKKNMFGYNPNKDIKFYKNNKKLFWEDKKFRNDFLSKIKDVEKYSKENFSFPMSWDYLFCSLLSPKNLFDKINGNHKRLDNPLFIAMQVIDKI